MISAVALDFSDDIRRIAQMLFVLVVGPLCFWLFAWFKLLLSHLFKHSIALQRWSREIIRLMSASKEYWRQKNDQKLINRGKKLERYLMQLSLKSQPISSRIELPQYKYFTQLLKSLLDLHKKFGRSIDESLLILKRNLGNDLLNEYRIREKSHQALGQCLIMFLGQWGMFSFMVIQMKLTFSWFFIIAIIAWQFLGIWILRRLIVRLQVRTFSYFSLMAEKIFTWMVLCQTDMDFNRIASINALDLNQWPKKTSPKQYDPTGYMTMMDENILEIIALWRKCGRTPASDFSRLGIVLGEVFTGLQEKFIKQVDLCVFMVMLLFFFASYLASIFWLMSSFLLVIGK
jgi:hypothetical protein